MRAGVNTSKKAMREAMAEGCGINPLCGPCDFAKKPVPEAWRTMPPGWSYETAAPDPLAGRVFTLRGSDALYVVVGPATPIGPGIMQYNRVSKRRQCEGAVIVRSPLGVDFPLTRSVVRERLRQTKPGRGTCACVAVPYPHREGSTPLCERHPDNLGQLAELSRDAYEGGERDEARFIASARRASKRGAKVETVEDANAVLRSLEAKQVEEYQKSERRRMAPRREYRARLARAKAALRAEGWAV